MKTLKTLKKSTPGPGLVAATALQNPFSRTILASGPCTESSTVKFWANNITTTSAKRDTSLDIHANHGCGCLLLFREEHGNLQRQTIICTGSSAGWMTTRGISVGRNRRSPRF